jgi:hypothetical protein
VQGKILSRIFLRMTDIMSGEKAAKRNILLNTEPFVMPNDEGRMPND